MRLLYLILAMLLVVLPAYAGTLRDDFENEEDFLNDKQLREEGVWGEDIAQFMWEDGAIKGQNLANGSVVLVTGGYGWKDYTVECKAKLITTVGTSMGLVLRRSCIDCLSGYLFLFGNIGASILGKADALKTSPFQANRDVWYVLKAVAQGELLEFYIDNKLVLEAKDNSCPAGKAGFVVSYAGGGKPVEALFDDFVMTGPEVKDGGHWKGQPQSKAVSSYNKLANTWGNIKHNR